MTQVLDVLEVVLVVWVLVTVVVVVGTAQKITQTIGARNLFIPTGDCEKSSVYVLVMSPPDVVVVVVNGTGVVLGVAEDVLGVVVLITVFVVVIIAAGMAFASG